MDTPDVKSLKECQAFVCNSCAGPARRDGIPLSQERGPGNYRNLQRRCAWPGNSGFHSGKRLTLPPTFSAERVQANLAYAQYVISATFGEGWRRATADAGPALRPPLCAKSQGPAHVAEKPDYFFFLNTSTIPSSPSTRTKSPVSITSVGSLSKSVMAGTSIFMAANTVRFLPLV